MNIIDFDGFDDIEVRADPSDSEAIEDLLPHEIPEDFYVVEEIPQTSLVGDHKHL